MIIYQQTNNGVIQRVWRQGDEPMYSESKDNEREVWDVIEVCLHKDKDEEMISILARTFQLHGLYSLSYKTDKIRIFGNMAKFIAANL